MHANEMLASVVNVNVSLQKFGFYWKGDERCELFCKKYGNTKCRHFTVNTSIEIERKKRLLLFYLVQYHQEIRSDRLILQLQVISPEDILTTIAPPLDEIDVLKHIDEDKDVKQNTFLDFEPHTPNKGKDPHHIDFDVPFHDCEE